MFDYQNIHVFSFLTISNLPNLWRHEGYDEYTKCIFQKIFWSTAD